MWEILFGYGIQRIYDKQTTAFEIGGEIVQTTVSGAESPQGIGKVTVASQSLAVVTSSRNDINTSRNDSSKSRSLISVGFNPFGPVLIYGAEQLLKLTGQDPYSKGEVY